MICINKNGQKNGQATILFEDSEQVALALLRDKHHMQNHGRYLNVCLFVSFPNSSVFLEFILFSFGLPLCNALVRYIYIYIYI